MRIRIALSSLLALLLSGSLIPAQTPVRAPDSHDQAKIAAASKIEPAMPLTFSVGGLTNDNKGMVNQSLMSIGRPQNMRPRVAAVCGPRSNRACGFLRTS